jgi:hypothetical protein
MLREEEAESLYRAESLALLDVAPKVRCLMLTCPTGRAWAFLRGGRWSTSQASKTFTVARVGPQRMPCYEHLERSFGFGGTEGLPIVTLPEELPEPEPEAICVTATQIPDVAAPDTQEVLTEIAVHPDREEEARLEA